MGAQSSGDAGLTLDADGAFTVGGLGAVLIEGLLSQSLVDLVVLDTDLRIVQAELRVPGPVKLSAEDIVGYRFTEVMEFTDPAREITVSRAVLTSGTPALNRLVGVYAAGELRIHSVSIFRLDDPGGRVIGLARTRVDVTEREKARDRLALLSAVRERVGRTLDIATTCQELVDTVTLRTTELTGAPEVVGSQTVRFADIAGVELVEGVVRGDDPPIAPVDPHVALRHVASVGSTAYLKAHPLCEVRAVPGETSYGLVLSDREARLLTLTPDALWSTETRASTEALIADHAHSLILAPLSVHGAVLGLLYFCRRGGAEPYDDEDVALVSEIAPHVALCIDNARRYTRERVVATTMQRRALPREPVAQTAVATAYLNLPGRRAGYWFDTIALPGARIALVVGDVAGKGVQAATAMGQLRTVVQTLAALDLDPEELMERLDETVTYLDQERAALPHSDPVQREELRACCVYAVFDPIAGTCTICRADHPGPVIAHPDGRIETPDIPEGPPLGSTDKSQFATCTFEASEDTVFALQTGSLLSDDEIAWGVLSSELRHPERPLRDLADAIVHALPEHHRPNAALLLARASSFPEDSVRTWDLPSRFEAASTARDLARGQLAEWGFGPETSFSAEMIVGELVTNAVRYGAPPVRLRIIRDRGLTYEVYDSSSAAPHLRHAGPTDEGGRGLFIVAQMTDQWGARFMDQGKIIWAEQGLEASM